MVKFKLNVRWPVWDVVTVNIIVFVVWNFVIVVVIVVNVYDTIIVWVPE